MNRKTTVVPSQCRWELSFCPLFTLRYETIMNLTVFEWVRIITSGLYVKMLSQCCCSEYPHNLTLYKFTFELSYTSGFLQVVFLWFFFPFPKRFNTFLFISCPAGGMIKKGLSLRLNSFFHTWFKTLFFLYWRERHFISLTLLLWHYGDKAMTA